MPRGIFRLKQVYEQQLLGNWSTKGDVWLIPSPFTVAHPFGYFGGGSGPKSTVDRIDYSSDTGTTPSKGPLSLARYGLAATGNADFGYFGGGLYPSTNLFSIVDRIDYSNDNVTTSPKAPLSLARRGVAATGNASFGYFGGGYVSAGPVATIDRVDYSNDIVNASPKGPLSAVGYGLAATGNASFGYFGAGSDPGGGTGTSTVDRIDYSNDTATISVRGPLSAARYSGAATGNASFGYFGAGLGAGGGAKVDRIDLL